MRSWKPCALRQRTVMSVLPPPFLFCFSLFLCSDKSQAITRSFRKEKAIHPQGWWLLWQWSVVLVLLRDLRQWLVWRYSCSCSWVVISAQVYSSVWQRGWKYVFLWPFMLSVHLLDPEESNCFIIPVHNSLCAPVTNKKKWTWLVAIWGGHKIPKDWRRCHRGPLCGTQWQSLEK